MSGSEFVPGQRWVSNTESELGLGIVVECENRRVSLSFPAAGERRVYAIDNAPLTRVIYNIGETIANEDGQSLKVEERHDNNGCLIYGGEFSDGTPGIIAELDLDSFVQFSRPLDRLFAGQIEKNSSYLLRLETLQQHHQHQRSSVFGLLGPRVQILPHQFYIANQVAERHNPRVLLADEVGLGKTIEAGLILHQQLLSGRVNRVLIVVPDSLVHQWLVEMLRRFNLHFTILDEETCEAIETGGEDEDEEPIEPQENPFGSAQLVLVGLSLFVENAERREQALAADWDLMVVDEAHHLRWSETDVSEEYRAIEALAHHVPALILITATPEQLGLDGHFARLRLLDPERYHDIEKFREQEQDYKPVADLVSRLVAPSAVEDMANDESLATSISDMLGADRVAEIIAADSEAKAGLLGRAVRDLLDRHGTGRVLFRNRRDAISGFPARHLQHYELETPTSYATHLATAPLDDLLKPERLLGEEWLALDSRVAWLSEWLAARRAEKVLLICADARTAVSLEEYLRTRHGVRSAVFHEGMGLVARDRAAAYFADETEQAELLVSSEIGSEGRNFQFAQHLVLFDVPLNPDLLEQRIGRLDRIGQRGDVSIHVPFYRDSAAAVMMRWYHEGLDAFEQVFPAGRQLYERFAGDIEACLRAPSDINALDDLLARTTREAEITRETLAQGRDTLLELNSFDRDAASDIVDGLGEAGRKLELSDFMDGIFDFFGVDSQAHGPLSVVVHPGEHMLGHSFPGLPEGGITGTYDRVEALAHEDWHFLTWEHPMVTGAIDMMLSSEFGNASLCALKAPFLKAGMLLLEAIFTISCPAPKFLQLQRYLPQATIRVVVDRQKRNLTEILTPERLDSVVESLKRHVAHEVAKHAREDISAMADVATSIAENQIVALLDDAKNAAREEQKSELLRLKALAEVNPNIRTEEIEFREDFALAVMEALEHAQVKLDAVRVGLAT